MFLSSLFFTDLLFTHNDAIIIENLPNTNYHTQLSSFGTDYIFGVSAETSLNELFSTTISLVNSDDISSSTYHYSIPTVKLYYPEPYIALPSLLHTDM